jgi:cytidine deaminase
MLSPEDEELVDAARAVLDRQYKPFWHTVSAALRMSDGRIVTGIHLGAAVGRLSICAEAVALGRAILDGGGEVVTAVAVRHPKPEEEVRDMAVVSPCGACREMFADHAPDAQVIVPGPAGLQKVSVAELLPLPYRR